MRCSTLCLLLCAALVSSAPSLLPGDPNYSNPDHAHNHGEHAHDHGEHAHDQGEHAHDHGAHAHDQGEHAHDQGAHAHDHGAHPEPHAHDGQTHPEPHAHDGQTHPEPQAHDGQTHPEPQAHDGQTHSDKAQPGPAFPGQAFPGQAFPGQAFPGQEFAGQAFPGQDHPGQAHPGQAAPEPGSSLTMGIPDFPVSYAAGDASAVSRQTAVSPSPVSAPQPSKPVKVARPSNPFLSGNVQVPSSSSFKVPVKPVLPLAQRPTPEPIKELNTNPLGGPAGPKGAVRANCPGPASALPCVTDAECDPYTGFLKADGVKLPYPITKDTPTVAIDQCKLQGTGIGVCCKHLPKPKPITTTTAVPLGVDYGQGLEHLKQPPTEKPINPFLPNYKPAY